MPRATIGTSTSMEAMRSRVGAGAWVQVEVRQACGARGDVHDRGGRAVRRGICGRRCRRAAEGLDVVGCGCGGGGVVACRGRAGGCRRGWPPRRGRCRRSCQVDRPHVARWRRRRAGMPRLPGRQPRCLPAVCGPLHRPVRWSSCRRVVVSVVLPVCSARSWSASRRGRVQRTPRCGSACSRPSGSVTCSSRVTPGDRRDPAARALGRGGEGSHVPCTGKCDAGRGFRGGCVPHPPRRSCR